MGVTMRRPRPLIPGGTAAGLLLWLASAAAAVVPGDPAPDFTLSDVRGNSFTLSSYRGKVVLLAFVGYD
jgi:cytochrome oxidase Cu insertion factor (SCO1/SenC/PrrC family)